MSCASTVGRGAHNCQRYLRLQLLLQLGEMRPEPSFAGHLRYTDIGESNELPL